MKILVTFFFILQAFRYDNLSEFTDTKWLFNCDVWFLLSLLINDPFHTLTSEHQIIHIFMTNLELWLDDFLELLQKLWSSSNEQVINMQTTHANRLNVRKTHCAGHANKNGQNISKLFCKLFQLFWKLFKFFWKLFKLFWKLFVCFR